MPYLPTAQSFLEQSTLLIAARPTTTRITTKYNLPHPSPPPHPTRPKSQPPTSSPPPPTATSTDPTAAQPPHKQPKKPSLTLKTYDPVSGTCLKYRTDKAAEVGRLVAVLGGCAGTMAGLAAPKEVRAEVGGDGMEGVEGGEREEEAGGGKAVSEKDGGGVVKEGAREQKEGKSGGQGKGGGAGGGGGGGGGKKKKGKR